MSVSEAVLAIDMSKSKKGRLPSFTELCDGKVGLIRTSCIYFGELKLCLTAVFFFFLLRHEGGVYCGQLGPCTAPGRGTQGVDHECGHSA